MLERLKALPGVTDATSAGPIPLDGGNSLARYGPLEAATDPAKFQQAITHFVQPGYFEFARTPMVAGRVVQRGRQPPEARVIIIDELIAARLFPNGGAIGQRMLARVTTDEPQTFEVIGVVKAPAPHHDDERRRGGDVLPGRLRAVRRGVPLGGADQRRSERDGSHGAERDGAAGSAPPGDGSAHVVQLHGRSDRADALRADPDRACSRRWRRSSR